MGLRSDHLSGTSFALKGETPVVRATGRRFGCSMISAITNRSELSFMVFEGTFKNATFIEFMKRLIRQATRKIYLTVDGHPVHWSAAVKKFVTENALGKSRPTSKADLIGTVRRHLHRRQKEPRVIRNLFKEKHVSYAA
ncbi:transposase [Burkholderia ubonensis]|uniref:transposase n=1 Tax=Burkholderia ubonensis TaxID=101571 RepID=UPI000A545A98|nr:transposase [Burkholderia ubonensis]